MTRAPMLARTPRRGHVHCECHHTPESAKLRRSHKRRIRSADERAARRDIAEQLQEKQ